MTEMLREETLHTDLTSWDVGPYHGMLPGPMKLSLQLDGEVVVSGSVETGFMHRGLEKAFELHAWQSALPYADRLDPECAVFGELALCLAVEEMSGLTVPPRAQMIRLILSELSRISGHMSFVTKMARAVSSETMIHYVLRDRERVLDLFELLTGARFSLNFLRFGGVSQDVTDGFIERVLETCELIQVRLKEYNDLFSFNRAFLKRSAGLGFLSPESVSRLGITGPNARASGAAFDVRKSHPYSGYDRVDFDVRKSISGDVHGRFIIRLREIAQSLEILRQAAEMLPAGEFSAGKLPLDHAFPRGEAYSRVESSRGLLGCHVVSDGTMNPCRVQFRAPSVFALSAIPSLLTGVRLEDVAAVLASLDIGLAEADR